MQGHKLLSKKYIAKRYAAALFAVALKNGSVQEVLDDMLILKGLIANDQLHKTLLFSSASPSRVKIDLLQLLLDGQNIRETVARFLYLLVHHNRMRCFNEVCNQYADLIHEYRGELHLVVESVEPLDHVACEEIAVALSASAGKKVIAKNRVNPELLGGLLFKLDYKMLDCSLRNKLHKLEEALLAVPIKLI